jgi:hypothetical protein
MVLTLRIDLSMEATLSSEKIQDHRNRRIGVRYVDTWIQRQSVSDVLITECREQDICKGMIHLAVKDVMDYFNYYLNDTSYVPKGYQTHSSYKVELADVKQSLLWLLGDHQIDSEGHIKPTAASERETGTITFDSCCDSLGACSETMREIIFARFKPLITRNALVRLVM